MTVAPESASERAYRLRGTHSYGIVLALLVVQFVLFSAAGDALWVRVAGTVLSAAILVLTYLTSGVQPRHRHVVELAAVTCAVAAAASVTVGGNTARGIAALLSLLLIISAVGAIVRGIGVQPVVNLRTVLGALCVYLMIGFFFAYAYAAIGAFSEEPFFTNGREESLAHFLYFSYVSQTTTGFGDFTADTNLGRTVTVVEVLFGQLYLVTVLALVVANIGRERRVRLRPDDETPTGADRPSTT
jgi:hypothetical protein